MDVGWGTLTTAKQVMGVMYANTSTDSHGKRRSTLDQARIVASRQLVAAILNTGLPNGASVPVDPVTGKDIITAARDALKGTSAAEILRLGALLDAYNNSGDPIPILDPDHYPIGSADPSLASSMADISVADFH